MDRRYRLRGRQDFARLRTRGRVYRHGWLSLSIIRNDLTHNRYGYITGKTLGNAVQRNRVRRLLREAVRALHAHVEPGFDILLIARPGIAGQPWAALLLVVQDLFRQAGMLRASS